MKKMENKADAVRKSENGMKWKDIVGTRGRIFQGIVIKKFDKRIVIEFKRTVKIPKFERFTNKKTRLHARVLDGIEVKVGDVVKVRECRPLSKMIHFVLIEVLNEEVVK
jgi:small subunit ribosomal protein S17